MNRSFPNDFIVGGLFLGGEGGFMIYNSLLGTELCVD